MAALKRLHVNNNWKEDANHASIRGKGFLAEGDDFVLVGYSHNDVV